MHAKDGPRLERLRVFRPRSSISSPNLKKVRTAGEPLPIAASPARGN